MRRVAITGLGAVSAAGVGVAPFLDAVQTGSSCIRPLRAWPANTFRFMNGAEAVAFDGASHFDDKQRSALDRSTEFALVAAREAVLDSAVQIDALRTAVITGCSLGGQTSMDEAFVDLYQKSLPRVNPLMIPRVMANAGASHVSMEFGIRGPAYSVSTACASSAHAIGQAFWLVRSGAVDCAITGGHEAVFSFGLLKAWEAMRVVSPDTCRPFSKNRKGMILGEGAGMLILEPFEQAKARGAHIYGEVVGFGMSSDAHHITQPSWQGAAQAMVAALEDGGIHPDQVGYVNAHGTGTPLNDTIEANAIRAALGNAVAVSSTKSIHGHALGAAGALEAIATAAALRDCVLPPTANFTERDDDCHIDVIANQPRRAEVEYALSNSFAFGGLNAVLAFRRSGA